jgi:hypothetical protein
VSDLPRHIDELTLDRQRQQVPQEMDGVPRRKRRSPISGLFGVGMSEHEGRLETHGTIDVLEEWRKSMQSTDLQKVVPPRRPDDGPRCAEGPKNGG